jgi:hypothetical protein
VNRASQPRNGMSWETNMRVYCFGTAVTHERAPQLGHFANFLPPKLLPKLWGRNVAARGEMLKICPHFSHSQSCRLAKKNWAQPQRNDDDRNENAIHVSLHTRRRSRHRSLSGGSTGDMSVCT